MAMGQRLLSLVILSSCFPACLSRILLFWAVDNSTRTKETLRANIEHVQNLGIEHDVILAHYKGGRKDWDQKWYKQHITHFFKGKGYKFHLLTKAYKEGEWEQRYELVWALDTDIDLTKVDLLKFLEMARQIDSSIVGPTFVEQGAESLVLVEDGSGRVIRNRGPHRTNKLQIPHPGCEFRHADFVEITAPILKSKVFKSLLLDCVGCIHAKSDWGLDAMWCKYASERFGGQACALIDKYPVFHMDWRTADGNSPHMETYNTVKAKYGRYWSGYRAIDCKRPGGGLEKIPQEIVPKKKEPKKKEITTATTTRPILAGVAVVYNRLRPGARELLQTELQTKRILLGGGGLFSFACLILFRRRCPAKIWISSSKHPQSTNGKSWNVPNKHGETESEL